MELKNIRLYRMTNIENVQHILKYGLTHKKSINSNVDYKPIGDNSLINTRNSFKIANGKILGDYIPFYFGLRTPMLYVIQNGFNGVQPTSPGDIVYFVTSLDLIQQSKVDFVYTDGHATDGFTKFYDPSDLNDINNQVDFIATNAKFWKKDDDLDFKRRKEAELLLEDDLPVKFILGIIVYSNKAEKILIDKGVKLPIAVKPNYYF